MDRISINRITGKLIEFQSGGDDRPDLMEMRLNTLLQNAINAGNKEEDIEVKWVTPEESAALLAPTVEEKKSLENHETKARLGNIDLKSIRSIREWIASREDCPKSLADCEAIAVQERTKLL